MYYGYMLRLPLPKNANDKLIGWLLVGVGLIALAISAALSAGPVRAKLSGGKSVNVASAPSSIRPSSKQIATYSVPATNPKYISIPDIAIGNTPVLNLGLANNGQIATPNNIYETGWYNASSKPGQAGAMFIFGHVATYTKYGIFNNLGNLETGARITITRGDNKTYVYQVVAMKIYPYNNVDMNAVLSPVRSGVPGLNLMTCTGPVIQSLSEYSERLVVFTSLVS
jgi:sortase (surface protein transpeptidase)